MILTENIEGQDGQLLAVLLDILIPPSVDGRFPSAANVGLFPTPEPWLSQGLHDIEASAQEHLQSPFLLLTREQQEDLVDKLRRKMVRFFSDLGKRVVQGYYQDERVVIAMGGEARPPFPIGYFVTDGDLTFLETVYERGPIYRKC